MVHFKFVPITEKAKDGFRRMYRFSDNDHWAWYNKRDGHWYYEPYIGPHYEIHPGEPTHYVLRDFGDESHY